MWTFGRQSCAPIDFKAIKKQDDPLTGLGQKLYFRKIFLGQMGFFLLNQMADARQLSQSQPCSFPHLDSARQDVRPCLHIQGLSGKRFFSLPGFSSNIKVAAYHPGRFMPGRATASGSFQCDVRFSVHSSHCRKVSEAGSSLTASRYRCSG